eukprot:6101050-Amphidinium_carterae.2
MVRRLWSLAEHTIPPTCMAGIRGSRSTEIVERMQEVQESLLTLEPLNAPIFKKLKQRSPFRQCKTQQYMKMLEHADWSVTSELRSVVRSDFSGLTQTKLIEDGFRSERHAEVNMGTHSKVSAVRTWTTLLSDRLTDKVHHFENMPFTGEIVPRGAASHGISGLFHPSPDSVPKDMKQIVSSKSKADWHSPSPMLALNCVEDLALLKWCRQHDCMDRACKSWLSILAVPLKVIVTHPDLEGGKPHLAGKTWAGACTLGLPLREVVHASKTFYVLDAVTSHVWMPIVTLEGWRTQRFAWRSPLHIKLASGSCIEGVGAVMEPIGEPRSLLHTCAEEAFYSIPRQGLGQLATEFGVCVPAGSDFAQLLLALCKHALGELSNELQLALVRKRLPHYSDLQSMLMESDDAVDLLDEADAKKLKEKTETLKDGEQEFRKAAKKLIEKMSSTSGSSRKGAGRGGGPASKKARRWPPLSGIDAHTPKETLDTFLPPRCKFGVDLIDRSWRLSCYGKRFSRAWGMYGVIGAAVELIQLAWDRALLLGHEQTNPYAAEVAASSASASASGS